MKKDIYISIKHSVTNWIDTITQTLPDAKTFDFDSTAEEEELEQTDLLGSLELYVSGSETTGEVGFKVAACTYEDPQIQRLNAAINEVVNACGGKTVTIPVLHHQTGMPVGILASDGEWMVSPVVRLQSRTRPFQTVSLQFNLTLTF